MYVYCFKRTVGSFVCLNYKLAGWETACLNFLAGERSPNTVQSYNPKNPEKRKYLKTMSCQVSSIKKKTQNTHTRKLLMLKITPWKRVYADCRWKHKDNLWPIIFGPWVYGHWSCETHWLLMEQSDFSNKTDENIYLTTLPGIISMLTRTCRKTNIK